VPIPIPRRPSGFVQGAANALLQIEVFIDIQCPFSAKTWPTLMAVSDHYGTEKVQLRIEMLSMANHRQSWDVTRAIFAVVGSDSAAFFKLATFLYQRQESFFNGPFRTKTELDLFDLILRLLGEYGYQTDPVAFITRLESDENSAIAKVPARIAFSRGVWSTPTIFINGAEAIQLGSRSTLADWTAVLDPLLA
jgi:protein-disulfide isomerase